MANKAREKQISRAVIKRLPRYRRYLIELQKKGVKKISSKDFSELIGYTASQIRQDLNNFGGFGQQGYGYSVDYLCDEIGNILGLNKKYRIVIVGYGRLGQAMARYIIKNEPSFEISGICDVKQKAKNIELEGAEVVQLDSLEDFIKKNDISIAVLTVPAENAQNITEMVCQAGIKGIWNFTAMDLDVPDNIMIENVHMSDSLHALTYYINER